MEEGHPELPTNSADSSVRGDDELRMFHGPASLGGLIEALEAYEGSPVILVRFLIIKKFTVDFSCSLVYYVSCLYIKDQSQLAYSKTTTGSWTHLLIIHLEMFKLLRLSRGVKQQKRIVFVQG